MAQFSVAVVGTVEDGRRERVAEISNVHRCSDTTHDVSCDDPLQRGVSPCRHGCDDRHPTKRGRQRR